MTPTEARRILALMTILSDPQKVQPYVDTLYADTATQEYRKERGTYAGFVAQDMQEILRGKQERVSLGAGGANVFKLACQTNGISFSQLTRATRPGEEPGEQEGLFLTGPDGELWVKAKALCQLASEFRSGGFEIGVDNHTAE